jgi:hypothetical protein
LRIRSAPLYACSSAIGRCALCTAPTAGRAARSTGWLSHWGEVMANTTASLVTASLRAILEHANGTGSVNFYMAHGGTNFGYWAGALRCPARQA